MFQKQSCTFLYSSKIYGQSGFEKMHTALLLPLNGSFGNFCFGSQYCYQRSVKQVGQRFETFATKVVLIVEVLKSLIGLKCEVTI